MVVHLNALFIAGAYPELFNRMAHLFLDHHGGEWGVSGGFPGFPSTLEN